MTDWIDAELRKRQLAEEAQATAADMQTRGDLLQHDDELIRKHGLEIIEAFTAHARTVVEEFRQKAGGDAAKQVSFTPVRGGGFILKKSGFPEAELECSLSLADHGILCVSHHTFVREGRSSVQRDVLALRGAGDKLIIIIGGKPASYDDVAKKFISPVLFPR